MTIAVGDKLPEVTLVEMTAEGPVPRTTADIFGGRKVALFSVPGAFTPTCSAKHLPGYVEQAASFTAKGVDEIVCIAVNDAFVMGAWGKSQNAGGKVSMLADGNCDFSKALGLEMDGRPYGMGMRGQRFSMIVEDGTVTSLNVEGPGEFHVSSADHMLGQL
ncbi:MAG: peroxiredoxin [Emcibacter sp.]|nr:peroxiredoxin [Emcibacter sp.]